MIYPNIERIESGPAHMDKTGAEYWTGEEAEPEEQDDDEGEDECA